MMNTGKIMTGFSLVRLSIAMMISPSGATVTDESCDVGCGIAPFTEETGCTADMHTGRATLSILDEPRTKATNPYER